MTPKELADHLNIKPRIVVAKANAGLWPCYRYGPKTIRFSPEHIEEIKMLSQPKPKAQTTVANPYGRVTRNSPRAKK